LNEACALVRQAIFPLQPYASTYGSGAGLLEFLLPLFGAIPR